MKKLQSVLVMFSSTYVSICANGLVGGARGDDKELSASGTRPIVRA
jgi:hypothetical protein